MVGKDLANEGITTSIEEVIRLNASAVGMSVFIDVMTTRTQNLMNLGRLIDGRKVRYSCNGCYGVGRELEKRDARYLGLCCRIAAELGARVVKTYWCENFDKVTSGCPVPVVMAGGPKTNSDLEVFEFVHDGMQRALLV